MATNSRRYMSIVAFRVSLAVLALLTATWAGHMMQGDRSVWILSSVLAASAAALLIWPFVVPAKNRTMSVYSLGYAFLLAGIFLLPPGALVLTITFALTLAGLMTGMRAYRTVFQLSATVLAFVGFSLAFNLGPRPNEILYLPALRAGLEVTIAAAALVFLLLIKSIALRIEQGDATPPWGAFQPVALVEAVFCLVYSMSIIVLARIHVALLSVVYVEIALMVWFLHRYRLFAFGVSRIPEEAPALMAIPGSAVPRAGRGDGGEDWEASLVRRAR
jgi:hypothetical protein